MDEGTIKRVLSIVTCYTPPYLDRENITMEIIFESWEHRIEDPSLGFIKNRCFNIMRQLGVNKRGTLKKLLEDHQRTKLKPTATENSQDQEEVNMLTKVITTEEKKVIWYRYYQDMTVKEISDTMKLPLLTVSEMLQAALFKMREAAA